jgi:hypothetical protein
LWPQAAAKRFVAASAATVESAVTRALAHIQGDRVHHAREVLTAIAEALAFSTRNVPATRRTSRFPARARPDARAKRR